MKPPINNNNQPNLPFMPPNPPQQKLRSKETIYQDSPLAPFYYENYREHQLKQLEKSPRKTLMLPSVTEAGQLKALLQMLDILKRSDQFSVPKLPANPTPADLEKHNDRNAVIQALLQGQLIVPSQTQPNQYQLHSSFRNPNGPNKLNNVERFELFYGTSEDLAAIVFENNNGAPRIGYRSSTGKACPQALKETIQSGFHKIYDQNLKQSTKPEGNYYEGEAYSADSAYAVLECLRKNSTWPTIKLPLKADIPSKDLNAGLKRAQLPEFFNDKRDPRYGNSANVSFDLKYVDKPLAQANVAEYRVEQINQSVQMGVLKDHGLGLNIQSPEAFTVHDAGDSQQGETLKTTYKLPDQKTSTTVYFTKNSGDKSFAFRSELPKEATITVRETFKYYAHTYVLNLLTTNYKGVDPEVAKAKILSMPVTLTDVIPASAREEAEKALREYGFKSVMAPGVGMSVSQSQQPNPAAQNPPSVPPQSKSKPSVQNPPPASQPIKPSSNTSNPSRAPQQDQQPPSKKRTTDSRKKITNDDNPSTSKKREILHESFDEANFMGKIPSDKPKSTQQERKASEDTDIEVPNLVSPISLSDTFRSTNAGSNYGNSDLLSGGMELSDMGSSEYKQPSWLSQDSKTPSKKQAELKKQPPKTDLPDINTPKVRQEERLAYPLGDEENSQTDEEMPLLMNEHPESKNPSTARSFLGNMTKKVTRKFADDYLNLKHSGKGYSSLNNRNSDGLYDEQSDDDPIELEDMAKEKSGNSPR